MKRITALVLLSLLSFTAIASNPVDQLAPAKKWGYPE